MNKYINFYKAELTANKQRFEELLERVKSADNLADKMKYAKDATTFAALAGSGYYSSSIIEGVFLAAAEDCRCENIKKEFRPNSFLHVMTQAYAIGGHTRVVERWMELSPKGQTHSLFFTTNKINDIPERLTNAVANKDGEILYTKHSMSDLDKGCYLRSIASGYEYIILHTHPHDFIPLIAFGTNRFKRPVIFYNHADHVFWLGISIADIVADLKKVGQITTLTKRMAVKSFILSVPAQHVGNICKDTALREKLGIPLNKKIILSYGGEHKYKPLLDMNFFEYVKQMTVSDDVVVVQIGMKYRLVKKWLGIYKHKNFIILDAVPHAMLMKYICEADLVIDSFPMPGGTAMIDAISYNIPVLSLKGLVGQFDYIIESKAYCQTIDELVSKSRKILDVKEAAEENVAELKALLAQKNSTDAFVNNLAVLYGLTPKEHSLHYFNNDANCDFIDSDAFICHSAVSEKRLFSFFGILVIKRKNRTNKTREICISLVSKKDKYISFKY